MTPEIRGLLALLALALLVVDVSLNWKGTR